MKFHAMLIPAAALLAATASAADKKTDKNAGPAAGTVFRLSPTYPKYVSCDAEFRAPGEFDGTGRWPNFFCGKPASDGSFTFDPASPKASFSLNLDKMCQPNGDQSRRVLGDLCGDGRHPKLTFTVRSAGAFQTATVETEGKGGKKGTRTEEFSTVDAVLDIDGRSVPVTAKATLRFHKNKSGAAEAVQIDCRFQIAGDKLGLKSSAPVEVRVSTMAYANIPAGKKK